MSKLHPCKDCGQMISNNASACPHCGAKVTHDMGIVGWVIVVILGVSLASAVITGGSQTPAPTAPKRAPTVAVATPQIPQKTPEQIAAEESKKELNDRHRQAVDTLISSVKEKMNDPDSFVYVKDEAVVNYETKEIHILMTYRGKNAFGGVLTKQIFSVFRADNTWKELPIPGDE